jgi:hemoglobin
VNRITVDRGLCGGCVHARTVASNRGATFLRCARHDLDPAFARYPRLPVVACAGFEAPAPEPPALALPIVPPPAAGAETPVAPRPMAQRRPRLFERMGGRAAVERVVREFYDRVEGDPGLRALFPADLAAGREKQALFLEQWLGGEPRYSARYGDPRLRLRHFPIVIDERAAGRWLRHMGEAFRAAGVGEEEIAEVFADLGPLAKHMVNADDAVPRTPLGDTFLT